MWDLRLHRRPRSLYQQLVGSYSSKALPLNEGDRHTPGPKKRKLGTRENGRTGVPRGLEMLGPLLLLSVSSAAPTNGRSCFSRDRCCCCCCKLLQRRPCDSETTGWWWSMVPVDNSADSALDQERRGSEQQLWQKKTRGSTFRCLRVVKRFHMATPCVRFSERRAGGRGKGGTLVAYWRACTTRLLLAIHAVTTSHLGPTFAIGWRNKNLNCLHSLAEC